MNGGVRSYEFAKRLVRDGHEVILIAADTKNEFNSWKKEYVDGIEVHWLPVKYDNTYNVPKRIFSFFKFMLLVTVHILNIKSDRIIATSTPLTIAVPAIIYSTFRRVPFIFEVRDVWPEVPIALGFLKSKFSQNVALLLERIAYKSASTIITLSPDMKDSIMKRCHNKNVIVIPNASDVELFFPDANCSSLLPLRVKLTNIKSRFDKVVFYTGTLGLVNNLGYILELANYSSGNVGFVIIGDGNELNELKSKAELQGTLGKKVFFIDAIAKNELYLVHEIFDVSCSTVLPVKELYANSANKIFDAFAAGTPILINHSGWLKGIIENEGCGIVLGEKPTSFEFHKLEDFLMDEDRILQARAVSKKLGETDFNREHLYSKFKDVIENEKSF